MTPAQYRAMLNNAVRDGNEELLGSVCAVLAENEAAKEILLHKGYGPARAGIDAIVKHVPAAPKAPGTPLARLFDIWSGK
jgi:hypothetical protein